MIPAARIAAIVALAPVALDGRLALDILFQVFHHSLHVALLAVHRPVVGALVAADAAGAHHLGVTAEHLLDSFHFGNDIGTAQAEVITPTCPSRSKALAPLIMTVSAW